PLAVAFMTVGELYFGAYKSSRPVHNQNLVDRLVKTVTMIHSDALIMMKFGKLKAELSSAGRPLPDADVLIAATAILHCTGLVTGNEAQFARFTELRTENWLR
ncbi:MAG: hypothetical protein R3301_13985, partial [Saprospiraceae bacterium]|nr:hypothetical protein [Saprospiraceae bacterium]